MQAEKGTKTMKERREKLYPLLWGILLICALPIMLLLSYWACRYSYYGTVDYRTQDTLVRDAMWKHILLFLAASMAVYGVDRLLMKIDGLRREKVCLAVLAATCMAAFLLGSLYVLKNPYYPVGDQINATAFAAYCREGNYSMLSPGGYVGLYQQQKGLGFLYEILFTLFGNFNYTPAKILHVLWWICAIAAGYGFLKLNADRAVLRIIYCVMMLGCTPFLLYLPYIYGDVLSIGSCMVLFWAIAAYEHYGKKRYLAIASFVAAIALLARKNTWIVLISVGIYGLLLSLRKKGWKYLLTGGVILLTASFAVKAVDVMYEYRSGYPDGIGIPSILWVAMGLQDTDGMAGVYNRYQQSVFEENDFQQEPAAQVGKEYIRGRIREFREHPEEAVDFFKRKLEGQWIEPLFESLKATESFKEDAVLPSLIANLYYGKVHDIVWKLANYYQSVVYLSGLLMILLSFGLWRNRQDVPAATWLPLIAIVGGFLFSILWEAQCRYVFPYYAFMVLYTPAGLYGTGKMILGRRGSGKKANDRQNTEKEKLREIA